ncbi:hypothetical protein NDU88_003272 [Pleurodeles waltl]|uniref:Uncharacterized protein n=1 Tax=Pleurodeles waltl TaxID=8319 RepID=A0AAV7SE16_PLEWA|nr:hypothetical protein NDU88_003272 [Pleurodeles waltl]
MDAPLGLGTSGDILKVAVWHSAPRPSAATNFQDPCLLAGSSEYVHSRSFHGNSREREATPPDKLPVIDDQPAGNDILPPMDDDTFQQLLDSIVTPSLFAGGADSIAGSPKESPTAGHNPSASPSHALNSEDP